MKNVILIWNIIFTILTFAGAAYVLCNGGRVSAGYAVVPMVFAVSGTAMYRRHTKK